MTLVHLQRSGHKPFISWWGNRNGRRSIRQIQRVESAFGDILDHNLKCVQKQLACFLISLWKNSAEIVNNFDWFKGFGFLDFIRDVGKHISINYMMAKDSVKSRLETACLLLNLLINWFRGMIFIIYIQTIIVKFSLEVQISKYCYRN